MAKLIPTALYIPHIAEKVEKSCPTMLGSGYFQLTNSFVVAKPSDIWVFLSSPESSSDLEI